MKTHFERYSPVIVQISTPQCTGSGFYYKKAHLIITNYHVVQGNCEVVIEGLRFKRQVSKVFFYDPKHDLAFVEPPRDVDLPDIVIGNSETLKQGDLVGAIGHPFGLKISTSEGIIANTQFQSNDIKYLQHSAAINPGNSGGPLINAMGEVIGVNTFTFGNAIDIGFALPTEYALSTIEAFQALESWDAARCSSCSIILVKSMLENGYCKNCGTKTTLPSDSEPYYATGVARTIEEIIEKTGHNIQLIRKSTNTWEVQQGSAKIEIFYHEQTGLITASAALCQLPSNDVKSVYEYLLRQNYHLEYLTFSVHEQDINLSFMLYDRFLERDICQIMFQKIFDMADYYDDILIEQFGALKKLTD